MLTCDKKLNFSQCWYYASCSIVSKLSGIVLRSIRCDAAWFNCFNLFHLSALCSALCSVRFFIASNKLLLMTWAACCASVYLGVVSSLVNNQVPPPLGVALQVLQMVYSYCKHADCSTGNLPSFLQPYCQLNEILTCKPISGASERLPGNWTGEVLMS